MAKKPKQTIPSKKQIKPVKGSIETLNPFLTWCIAILIFSVSVSFYIATQAPTVDIKWLFLEVGVTLLAFLWLIHCSIQKSWDWVGHPIHLPLLIFAVTYFIAQLMPGDRFFLLDHWIQLSSLLLIYLVVSQTTKNIRGTRIIIQGLLVGGLIASLYGIIQKMGWDPIHWEKNSEETNIASMLGNSDYFGWFLAPLFSLSIAFLFIQRKNTLQKVLSVIYFLTISIALFIAGNRAGVVAAIGSIFLIGWLVLRNPALIKQLTTPLECPSLIKEGSGGGWMIFFNSRTWRWLKIGIVVILVFGVIGFWHRYSSRSDIAIKGRFLHWQTSIQMIRDHPILGVGPGNYFVNYLNYQAKILKDPRNSGYHRISQEVKDINTEYAHNDYLQALTDTGIIGFASFLFLLLTFLWVGYHDFQQLQDRESLWLYLGCYGGILAILISALFGFPLHVPASGMEFWVILGLAVSLCRINQPTDSTNRFWHSSMYENPVAKFFKAPLVLILITVLFAGYGYWTITRSFDNFLSSFYIRIGRVYAEDPQHSDIPLAVQFMERAIAITPDNGLAHYYLGGYYARSNRLDDAITQYTLATTTYDDVRMEYNLAQIYFTKRDYTRSEEYYRKTLLLNDTFYQCYRQLGFIDVYVHNDPKKAIEEWNRYLAIQKTGDDVDKIRESVLELEKQVSK